MRLLLSIMFVFSLVLGCQEKEFDPNDPAKSFIIAKEPYEDKSYDVAIKRLGEFKSRFPYSKFSTEAELLIANAHFELGHYPEAAVAYSQFITLHPKHPKTDYAQHQIGMSYWKEAPEAEDREQDLSSKAIKEWTTLIEQYPHSELVPKTKELITEGKNRIIRAGEFVARFYCKQEVWHSCAFRYMQLLEHIPADLKNERREALTHSANALEKMLDFQDELKRQGEKDQLNLYVKNFSRSELEEKINKLKQLAQAI